MAVLSIQAPDSLVTEPGLNRIRLSWESKDPEVVKSVVYWDHADSIVVPVNHTAARQAVVVTGLSQGNHTFVVYLYDEKGHASGGIKRVVQVYGDTYVAGLQTERAIATVFYDKGFAKIIWGGALAPALGMELVYTDTGAQERSVPVWVDTDTTLLQDYREGTGFWYRLAYKPEADALDTVYAGFHEVNPQSFVRGRLTVRLLENSTLIGRLNWDTAFELSPGVTETDVSYQDPAGSPLHLFFLTVDTRNPGMALEAAIGGTFSAPALETVPDMAAAADRPGHRVVAAVNADFFSLQSPWDPYGIMVQASVPLKMTYLNTVEQFLAVLDDGQPYIGSVLELPTLTEHLIQALGGQPRLLENNVPTSLGYDLAPRTGVGVDDNGVVYFLVADGRSSSYSVGLSLGELGELLAACGARNAVNLDGGGSSILVIEKKDHSGWAVRNRPSDGAPRAVRNGWLVVAKEP